MRDFHYHATPKNPLTQICCISGTHLKAWHTKAIHTIRFLDIVVYHYCKIAGIHFYPFLRFMYLSDRQETALCPDSLIWSSSHL